MNVAMRPTISVQEFLAWEERQELRYEFDGYRATAMVGGTEAHDIIAMNLAIELGTRLRGSPCRVQGSSLKIEVAGRIRYPDAFVVCTPVNPTGKVITDPIVVFEILSDSTAVIDQTVKNDEYRATASIQRYVMLSQNSMTAIVYERAGGGWVGSLVTDQAAVLAMPEIGVELPLAALYERLDMTSGGNA